MASHNMPDSGQGPKGSLAPPRRNFSQEQIQWLKQAWDQKNPSYKLDICRGAGVSLRDRLRGTYFINTSSRLQSLCQQESYRIIEATWGPGRSQSEIKEPPDASHCEAIRLMNGLFMPDHIIRLLKAAGFDAYKCCDPSLPPEEKRLSNKPEKRTGQQLESPGVKKLKTKPEQTAVNIPGPQPTNQTPLRNNQSQASASPKNPILKVSASAKTAPQKPAEAPIKQEGNNITPKNTDSQAAPAIVAPQNPTGSMAPPTSSTHANTFPRATSAAPFLAPTDANKPMSVLRAASAAPAGASTNAFTPANAPQAVSAAEEPARAPTLDFSTILQNAISIKTASISAAIDAQLRQHREDQKKRDEVVQKALEDVQECARGVKAAVEEDEKARQNLKLSLEKLDRSLAAANEKLAENK